MIGTSMAVWADEYDWSQYVAEVDLQIEAPEADRTSLASTAQEYMPLLPRASVQINGYFDGVMPNGYAAEMEARLGASSSVVSILTDRNDSDCAAYVLADAANYELNVGSPTSGLITLSGRFVGRSPVRRGLRIYDGTFSAISDGAAVDFGAGVSTGGLAALHVASITGTANAATITVESSPDNSTWLSEGSFSVSAVGGYTLVLSGTVSRYVRLACDNLGGATAMRCMAIVSL